MQGSKEDFLYLGFKFALFLVGSNDPRMIREKLQALLNGDTTLLASPDELRVRFPALIKEFEQQKGSPATEAEKKYLLDGLESVLPKNRAEQDTQNRELAAFVLQRMDEEATRRNA